MDFTFLCGSLDFMNIFMYTINYNILAKYPLLILFFKYRNEAEEIAQGHLAN